MKFSTKRILSILLVTWIMIMLYFFSGETHEKCQLVPNDVSVIDQIATLLQRQIVENEDIKELVTRLLREQKETSSENKLLLRSLLNKTTSSIKAATKQEEKKNDITKSQGDPPGDKFQDRFQSTEPTYQEEFLKRKIKNNAIELLYSLKSKFLALPEGNNLIQRNKGFQQLSTQHADLMANIERLLSSNDDWKQKEMKSLEDLVQKRIRYLQNPSSCDEARKLRCNINKNCGFGCQIHHVTYCLLVAFGSNRTMILLPWILDQETNGWDLIFQPVSDSCTTDPRNTRWWTKDSKEQAVFFPPIEAFFQIPPYAPQGIPKDIAPRLKRLHGQPGVWWVGQFIKYLIRGQDWFESDLREYQNQVGYDKPIVGMHVRRTDKITEASYHKIKEYMGHVIRWYDVYDMMHIGEKKVKRRVYLATDDPTVINEAKESYKEYEFINFNAFSESAFNPNARKSLKSIKGVIADIHLLSLSNYIVCTFSSQVCRLAYELMQTRRPDASFDAHSLDDVYYYGGQKAHRQLAIHNHKPDPQNDEIELAIGDILVLAGNHWDGYSKGLNTRTGKRGLYPSWKVEDIVEEVKYPTYPKANERR